MFYDNLELSEFVFTLVFLTWPKQQTVTSRTQRFRLSEVLINYFLLTFYLYFIYRPIQGAQGKILHLWNCSRFLNQFIQFTDEDSGRFCTPILTLTHVLSMIMFWRLFSYCNHAFDVIFKLHNNWNEMKSGLQIVQSRGSWWRSLPARDQCPPGVSCWVDGRPTHATCAAVPSVLPSLSPSLSPGPRTEMSSLQLFPAYHVDLPLSPSPSPILNSFKKR